MKQTKRILALFLAVLCFCMIPLSAFAETLDEVSAAISTEQETEEPTAVVPPQESETAPEPGASSTGPAEEETPPVAPAEGETEQPAEPTQPEQEYVPGFEVVLPGGAYVWPVPSSTTVSQGYGSDVHDALDIAAAEGEAVLAAEAGTVTAVQEWDGVSIEGNQSYGNMVEISHEDGNTTLYAHLSEIPGVLSRGRRNVWWAIFWRLDSIGKAIPTGRRKAQKTINGQSVSSLYGQCRKKRFSETVAAT